jgi:hypothetical protein
MKELSNPIHIEKTNFSTYEFHIHIDNSNISINKENTSCCDILKTLLVIIIGLPFIFTDLYYAYSPDSCLVYNIPNMPKLETWLFVSGWYSMTGIIITIIVFVSFLQLNIGINNNNLIIIYMKIFCSLFNLLWMIIGSVIFWRYLEPIRMCSNSLSIYMWIRLIFGLLSIFTNFIK